MEQYLFSCGIDLRNSPDNNTDGRVKGLKEGNFIFMYFDFI